MKNLSFFISFYLRDLSDVSVARQEDAEIQFGTSYLRLVGLLGGLESPFFLSLFFLPCSSDGWSVRNEDRTSQSDCMH
jgi:hypothetical protein